MRCRRVSAGRVSGGGRDGSGPSGDPHWPFWTAEPQAPWDMAVVAGPSGLVLTAHSGVGAGRRGEGPPGHLWPQAAPPVTALVFPRAARLHSCAEVPFLGFSAGQAGGGGGRGSL